MRLEDDVIKLSVDTAEQVIKTSLDGVKLDVTNGDYVLGKDETNNTVNILTTGGEAYNLPPATRTTLGGVIVGDGVSVDNEGRISVEQGQSVVIDNGLSTTSANPVENRVITTYVNNISNRVDTVEGGVAGNTSDIADAIRRLDSTEQDIIANYNDIQTLGTMVTANEASISAVSEALNDLSIETAGNFTELTNDLDNLTNAYAELQSGLADKQDQLTAGANITIVDNVISASGGGGGSAVTSVNGQTGDVVITVPSKTSDLTNDSGFVTSSVVNGYAKTADLATVATSGSYDDLSNKPTIPSEPSVEYLDFKATKGSNIGTVNRAGAYKYGKVVHINASFNVTGSLSSSINIFKCSYLPKTVVEMLLTSNGKVARCYIDTSGNIHTANLTLANNDLCSLMGVYMTE